jgi:hypothetical protein
LLVALLGYSMAYYFDAAQGRVRRAQAVAVIRRQQTPQSGSARLAVDSMDADRDLPRIHRIDPRPRTTFRRAPEGISAQL